MSAARRQNLRVLEGLFVLRRVTDIGSVAVDANLLAFVAGPDGGASMRRAEAAGETTDDAADDGWAALWERGRRA